MPGMERPPYLLFHKRPGCWLAATDSFVAEETGVQLCGSVYDLPGYRLALSQHLLESLRLGVKLLPVLMEAALDHPVCPGCLVAYQQEPRAAQVNSSRV